MVFRYKHGDRPLDGYTIQRGVGSGGFGEVYYALSDGGRQVALKVLQQNPEIELRGVGQCMNLKSPYLVTIFDVKKSADDTPFVIMEYVTGPSLRDLLHEAPEGLGAQKAVFFTREIARGLVYLHECGIVHRDLKPENIFFEDGAVKIGDYGLSKYISVSRQSCQTISVGTVHYMAPEIGSGRYHRGIDIYALGIILFEMLTGRVPFTGDSFGEILMKHLTVEPDLSGVAAPFDAVIRKALLKKPEERYGRADQLIEDLLKSPEVEGMLRDFRPESVSKSWRRPEEPVGETVVLGQSPPRPAPAFAASPPPIPPQVAAAFPREGLAQGPAPAPRPAQELPPVAPAAPLADSGFFSSEKNQVRLFAFLSTVAMSVVIALLSPRSDIQTALGSFFIIVSGAGAVLLAERDPPPGRFSFEPGFPRRLITLCIASPLYLLFTNVFLAPAAASARGTVIALIVCTAIVKWGERTRRDRLQRVNLSQAFLAGLAGFIAALIIGERFFNGWVLVAGPLAAISMLVNVCSPFAPPTPRRKSARGGGGAAQPAAVSPPPQPEPAFPPPGPEEWFAESPRKAAGAAAPGPAASAGPVKPMRPIARIFWLSLSALLLGLGLTFLIISIVPGTLHHSDRPAFLCMAAVSLIFFGPTFRIGSSPTWPGTWPMVRSFSIRTCIAPALCSALMLLSGELRGEEIGIAIAVIVFSGVFTFFMRFLPKSFSHPGRHIPAASLTAAASGPIPRELARRTGPLARIFWLGLSASLLGLGLTILIISFTDAISPRDRVPWLCVAAGCLVYFISTFQFGISPTMPGLWAAIRRFLIDACIVSAISASGFLLFENLRGEEVGIAIAFLIFSLVFILFLGLLPRRFSGAKRVIPEVSIPGPDAPGWSALGAILVTLGFSVTLGSALLASGLGQPVIQELGGEGAAFLGFVRSGMHFFVGCGLFLPGLFCLLRSRQASGAAHVFRGALGFAGAGTVVYLLARALPEISSDAAGKLRFTQVWAGDLIGLFSLGVLTALLLFWPAKALPSRVEWRSEVRS